MTVSLKNMAVAADQLREKLLAEQEAKEKKMQVNKIDFNELKFKGDLIGSKVTYVLRILPHTFIDGGLSEPWVKTMVHIFPNPQGVKKFALCPVTTQGKGAPCPMCEKSRELFKKVNAKEASKAEEDVARRFYHKPRYFVNLLVIEDPRLGDKNQKGKVLVWEFGQQIFDRMTEALVDQKKNFYDVNKGFNFSLVVKKKGEFPNYESSFFAQEPTPISTDDAELERISSAIVDLNKFAINKGPKSYEVLKLLMEGKEPIKNEKDFDSETGQTIVNPMNKVDLNENIDLDGATSKETVKTETVKVVPKQIMSDDDLLSSLDDLVN